MKHEIEAADRQAIMLALSKLTLDPRAIVPMGLKTEASGG